MLYGIKFTSEKLCISYQGIKGEQSDHIRIVMADKLCLQFVVAGKFPCGVAFNQLLWCSVL